MIKAIICGYRFIAPAFLAVFNNIFINYALSIRTIPRLQSHPGVCQNHSLQPQSHRLSEKPLVVLPDFVVEFEDAGSKGPNRARRMWNA
jgi:hypothetical protein